MRWFIAFEIIYANLGWPRELFELKVKAFLKTFVGIGRNRKLDYIKLFKINVWLQMHNYPWKYLNLYSLELWDNDKLSTDQTASNSAFMP